MEQILSLIVMLASLTHVAESACSSTHNTSVCSAAPGGSVFIQVINNASGHQVWCNKKLPSGLVSVFKLREEQVKIHEGYTNRIHFFIHNGTFQITVLQTSDSGQYLIEAFNPDGILVKELHVQLDVQENTLYSILIPASAGLAVLLLLIVLVCVCCCVCKRNKRSGSSI